MAELKIDSFPKLHAALEKYRADKRWLFRGHASSKWQLIPKVGRPPYAGVDDQTVLESWKRQAVEYLPSKPQSDWEWLAIAQHHGLATRLLDWTTNPLNACYFAVRDTFPGDAVVFAAKFKSAIKPEVANPFSHSNLAIYRPHRVVPRITRQGGMFTAHPKPAEPIEATSKGVESLDRLIIKAKYRKTLLSELAFYGVNPATLFPDLDGLSEFVNWTIETKEYWKFAQPSNGVEP
ncbi:FRG domain-containing protein [Herbaspirillum sp. HC18]|nr:FRG domain-containing protein [Herbaspirillum sp. HC18]